MIVLAEKDHGKLEDACHVHSLVKIPARTAAVAEIDERGSAVFPVLCRHRDAHGMEDLGPHRNRDGKDVHALGDLHAPLISGPVLKEHVQGKAQGDIDAAFPVGRKKPVPFFRGQCASELRGLLSQDGRVRSEPSLPLEGQSPLIKGPRQYEKLVHPL